MLPHEKDFCTSKHSRHCHDRPSRPTPLPGKEKSDRDILIYPEQRIFKKGTVTSLGSQMPYKTSVPHATHRQESAAAQDPLQDRNYPNGEQLPWPLPAGHIAVPRAAGLTSRIPAPRSRGGRLWHASPGAPFPARPPLLRAPRQWRCPPPPRPTPRPHSPARAAGAPRPQTLSTGTRRGARTWLRWLLRGCPDTGAALPKGTAVSKC